MGVWKSLATLLLAAACSAPIPTAVSKQDITASIQEVNTALENMKIRHRQESISADTFYDFSKNGTDIVGNTEMAYEDLKDMTHDVAYPHVTSDTRMLIYKRNESTGIFITYNRATVAIPKRSKEIFPAAVTVEIDEQEREFKDVYEIEGLLQGIHRKADVSVLVDHKFPLPHCSQVGYPSDKLLLTEKGAFEDEYRCSPETPLREWELPLQDLAKKIIVMTERGDGEARKRLLEKIHL